jgi:hypothetical protein
MRRRISRRRRRKRSNWRRRRRRRKRSDQNRKPQRFEFLIQNKATKWRRSLLGGIFRTVWACPLQNDARVKTFCGFL